MYFTDTPTGVIARYPYNPDNGEMATAEGKPHFTCPYEGGAPDGHCQDSEGAFWISCFGTGKVVRVNPEGQVIAEVEVPTRCVSVRARPTAWELADFCVPSRYLARSCAARLFISVRQLRRSRRNIPKA